MLRKLGFIDFSLSPKSLFKISLKALFEIEVHFFKILVGLFMIGAIF